jgi:hypothetical protein
MFGAIIMQREDQSRGISFDSLNGNLIKYRE